ncbi:MAG: hypothetical protein IJP94_04200 [Clostridia bacterium]|nr:hypothetical protein [Clostridia bacterium]MBQ3462603.1 hypothetical protein [Clostridia bacterium]MBR0089027.1 hypothetical protein [Clostridia bacterium]
MKNEWSGFFEYVCSMYSGEIAELLENTEYKSLGDKFKETGDIEFAERKAACYYEQAALVALRHFMNLGHDTNVL